MTKTGWTGRIIGYYARIRRRLRPLWRDRHTSLIALAFVIGLLSGLVSIGFRALVQVVHVLVFEGGSDMLGVHDGGWRIVLLPLLPMAGALLLTPLELMFPGEVRGYTFHRFLETVNLTGGILRFRSMVIKILGPAITIGTGGSAGVEGPIATIGGTIGSLLGQSVKASGGRMKLLIASGAAGAIAATFNAPVAGVMFAMEIVLLGNYELNSFVAIVIAAGIAKVVANAGAAGPIFSVPAYQFQSPVEMPLYIMLGLAIGVLAVLYIRVFYRVRDMFEESTINPYMKPFLGAFAVGVIGIFMPQVLGDGYEAIEGALGGHLVASVVIPLIFLKIMATALTLGAGGAGGVFAPAIFIGAMAGGAFGLMANQLFPNIASEPGVYAIVGVGAFLASATHAPLTGIFLVFELTGQYEVIVPVMFASIIGTVVAKRLYPDSIDTVILTREGKNIHAGRETALMGRIKVRDVMIEDVVTIHEDKSLTSLLDLMIDTNRFYVPVVDSEGILKGIVSIQDVRPVILKEKIRGIVRAGDLATEDVVTVTPEDDLNMAMGCLSTIDIDELPVVDSLERGRLVGMLRRFDVITAYNREVLKEGTAF